MRLVFLDSKPLGMVANPGNNPDALRCRQWARDLWAAGVSIFVPEICDYELRRKLIHVGATSSLARLDREDGFLGGLVGPLVDRQAELVDSHASFAQVLPRGRLDQGPLRYPARVIEPPASAA